jgi:tetratricopeptide (TPR) repeat protein
LGYHLVNVLLHAGAASLVFFVLRRLSAPGAFLAAAIFAFHPVQVESVAWITEQKNTLSAVFYLSAMLVYLHFDQSRQKKFYLAALGLFVLGLLSKTVTATLPAALLVIFWWQRGTLSWKKDVLPLIPFFLLGAIAGLFTAWVERTMIGAEGADFELSFLQRGLLAGRVIWFYLGKLIWPAKLTFIYPRWDVSPEVWWQWLFPLATLAVLVGLWMIHRRWRAPLAGWLLFVGTLFPVLGFLNVFPFIYSFVADHFQYLACLGVVALASAGITLGIARLPQQTRLLGHAASLALVGILALLTWRQSHMYTDIVRLYQTTIARNPNCWMAYYNLGIIVGNEGHPEEAIKLFKYALQVRPHYAEAHNNMGVQLDITGRLPEAIEHYEEALRIRPEYLDAHSNLGLALSVVDRLPEATSHLEEALRLAPDDFATNANLALVYSQANRPEAAIAAAEKAAELARSQQQLALVAEMETWLREYRASLEDPAKPPAQLEIPLELP